MDTYGMKTASASSLAGAPVTKIPADTITSDLGHAIAVAEANMYTAERIRNRLLGAAPESGTCMTEPQGVSIGEDISRLMRSLDRTRSVLETVEATLG